MGNLKIRSQVLGIVGTNCYLAFDDELMEGVIIDPADNGPVILNQCKELGVIPKAVLLTHGHFDHASAAGQLAEQFGLTVYAGEAEKETLENPALNLSGWDGREQSYHAGQFLKDEQEIDLAGFHIRVLFTPGHTPGGCCYYLSYQNALFSGDTLFHMSVGRTDFPKGSMSQLVRSIHEKLMPLPDSTKVLPGHGEWTTIGKERQYNPFL